MTMNFFHITKLQFRENKYVQYVQTSIYIIHQNQSYRHDEEITDII